MSIPHKPLLGAFVLGTLVIAAFVATDRGIIAGGPACGIPDGLDFDGTCCSQGDVQLPQFPGLKQNIRYITWRRCNLARNKTLCVDIGRPAPLPLPDGSPARCGVFTIPFNMRTCGGQMIALFRGDLIGTYARTWVEETNPDNPGPDVQVWRILINGDLEPTDFLIDRFGTNPHIPQCYVDTDNKIHWFGYIDYRQDCVDGTFTAEWAIDHECDRYHHNEDGGRPAPAGGYHPQRSFNMVGPSLFTPTTDIPFSQGAVVQENTREIFYGRGTQVCLRDDPIAKGFLEPLNEFCPCDGQGPQYALTDFFGLGVCGSSFFSDTSGEKAFVQKKFGFFTGADGNPTKAVLFKLGDVQWTSECFGTQTREYFEGVETIGGPPAFTFDIQGRLIPLAPDFDDDASSNGFDCEFVKGVPHISCRIISSNLIRK